MHGRFGIYTAPAVWSITWCTFTAAGRTLFRRLIWFGKWAHPGAYRVRAGSYPYRRRPARNGLRSHQHCAQLSAPQFGQSLAGGFAGTGIRHNDEPADATPPYFLLKELVPGYLFGVYSAYRTPEDYLVDETEALRFDVSFLPKQRLKLPNQLV